MTWPNSKVSEWALTFLTRCFLKVSAEVLYSFKEDLLLGSSALGHQVDVVLDFAPVI